MSEEIVRYNQAKAELRNVHKIYTSLSENDQKLIDETITNIQDFYQKAAETLHYQVGELILSKIFDDDFETASDINKSKTDSRKVRIFRCLEDRIKKYSGEGRLPKKTWLYNSVNLVLDRKLLQNILGYKELSISHKIEILCVNNVERKKELITRILDDSLSVRGLRGVIGKSTAKKEPGLLTYINNPRQIYDIDSVKLVGGKKRERAIAKAKTKIISFREDIVARCDDLERLQSLLARLESYTPERGRKKNS